MITINEKLYITKDVNEIVVSYCKEIVLRKLLNQFSFTLNEEQQCVSELIKEVNVYFGSLPDIRQLEDMLNLINHFIKACDKKELTSLYFWLLNKKYLHFYDEFKHETDYSIEAFNYKFGRELAFKLYNPDSTELKDELYDELQSLLICFASEFDFSLVNEYSIIEILEKIDIYCF